MRLHPGTFHRSHVPQEGAGGWTRRRMPVDAGLLLDRQTRQPPFFSPPCKGQVLAFELPWLQNFKRDALEGRCSPRGRLPTFSLKGSLLERGKSLGRLHEFGTSCLTWKCCLQSNLWLSRWTRTMSLPKRNRFSCCTVPRRNVTSCSRKFCTQQVGVGK